MAKPAVSREAFRGLFAFYAAKAHHDHKHDGEHRLPKLFGSTNDIPANLLQLWADRAELLGPEIVATVLGPRTQQIVDRGAPYDQASDFLRALLKDMERRTH
ncbi:hypothetical protein [Bradyrhizobium cosmicum]|uniref:hypothetical protein n=1 Tax=Bradyrhizobium cosmicum TaxID=1404864 RepID=UPI0028ECE2FE|nr:hypothetical protein [Bradyrhizobium cosmicum]